MKSPLVKSLSSDDLHKYSDLQVLKSAAGYYIGTVYTDGSFTEPGSRDSSYFKTEVAAQGLLDYIVETGDISPLRTEYD